MRKLYILLCLLCFLPFAGEGKDPDWLNKIMLIEPLKSSKQDVENAFNPKKITYNFESSDVELKGYVVDGGKIAVVYSTGKCPAKKNDDPYAPEIYKAEKDIVISITFFPESLIRFSRYKVNRKQLTKTTDGHDPGWDYVNTDSGIRYKVVNGYLSHITLTPVSKYSHLKCIAAKL